MTARRRCSPASLPVLLVLALAACASPQPSPSAGPTATASAPTASPTIATRHAVDGEIDLAGLRHDSRHLLYRTPGGAVPAGTAVTLRLRTFAGDVETVELRLSGINAGMESRTAMSPEARATSCYDEVLDTAGDLCDFWAVTLDNAEPDNLWYHFVASDGERKALYSDDTSALDGGQGAAAAGGSPFRYALTVYEPGFEAPEWARSAVAYQIFPDRFRNGDPSNDPQTGDVRYDDPVLALDWGALPEGYCRSYASTGDGCPSRFDAAGSERPRGRDYFGGDLAGVIEQLPYLEALGVTAIYFNPIFDAASNHGYDTQHYERVDPYFGTNELFSELTQQAAARGINVILDGVFNHTSSDSPWFDRYGHFDEQGACESIDSEWRDWYRMTNVRGPCAGPDGEGTNGYLSWAGFDSLPVLVKSRQDVRDYFIGQNLQGCDEPCPAPGITYLWLGYEALGWRMDVAHDPTFPEDYWSDFRNAVKDANQRALTISETWQKDDALLRNLRGDRFDTTMNYRLRDAVLGLLAPQRFDAKGFPDSGRPLTASEFAARLLAQQEDYAPAAYYSLMNLLDSHDTERVLWTLTPGAETRAERELDEANLAEGKARLRLASLIQYSLPGMPTVYYGDEVGLTGDDDPDDRRTYPWADLGGDPDEALLAHYQALAALRADLSALVDGQLRVLSTDDEAGVVVLARRSAGQAVIVALNVGAEQRSLALPTEGLVPDATGFDVAFSLAGATAAPAPGGGGLELMLPALGAIVLASAADADLEPPAPPTGLRVVGSGGGQVELAWQGDAAGYNVYRSALAGGGWVRVNAAPVRAPNLIDGGAATGRTHYYVVTALDEAGNESGYSSEVAAQP